MTLRNPKLFGLHVDSHFADVKDKDIALNTLNLPPLDLDIIRGSKDAGASRVDWLSFSRLVVPLHETLDRYNKESSTHNSVLLKRAGTDVILFGNLEINGSVSGSAIRYRYLDFSSSTIKFADISTSRVSAWSSSDPRANDPDLLVQGRARISYGSRVSILKESGFTGSKIKFGSQSNAATVNGLPRLQTTLEPERKEFKSEIPTHKIAVVIDEPNSSATHNLFVMKGIPVIFRGFFRRLNATVKLTDLIVVGGEQIRASWKIVEKNDSSRYSNYADRGDTTTSISYRASSSKDRFIKFYYNPDKIQEISIRSANISKLPEVKFISALSIDFAYNRLREFPDLTSITPNLERVFLMRNPFYQSEFENERKIQNSSYSGGSTTGTVLDKIPGGIKGIYLEGTFYGSITQNTIADRFQQLEVLNFNRGSAAYFHPDAADSSNTLPNVSNTVVTYGVQSNDFRAIDGSANGSSRRNVKQLTNLKSLNLYGNYYLNDSNFAIAADNIVIESINIGNTALSIPFGLSGKNSLKSYSHAYGRATGKFVDTENGGFSYKFNACNELRNISMYHADLTDTRFPEFNNANLATIDVRYSGVKGGNEFGNEDFVIHSSTFANTPKLATLYIDSGRLLNQKPISPTAFDLNPNFTNFWYRSYGRTNGALPSFSSNPSLRFIWMHHNAFTGACPNFQANPRIYYVRLSNNRLSGQIPAFKNLSSLYYMFLQNNQFTSAGDPENLQNLYYYYAHNNQLTGSIPDFSECPRLRYLILYNNQLTSYKSGSLATAYRLRFLDVSNNDLTEQAVESLLDDLKTNWQGVNRGRVTVNLRANGSPSPLALETVEFLRSKGWNVTIDQ